MARVTIEDCVLKVPNRFELVVYAAQRTRQISAGAPLTVERDNNKNPVIALHEIANGGVDIPSLREAVIKSFRLNLESDFQDDELSEIFAQDTSAQSFGVRHFEDIDPAEELKDDSGLAGDVHEDSEDALTNDSLEDEDNIDEEFSVDEDETIKGE